MSSVLVVVLLAVFGLAVGSFLNVVIVRVPAGESLLHPPSRCPLCETAIAPRDNIPVVSWLLLRGRCRGCGEPIPAGYPLVEAGNALLWVVTGLVYGLSWAVVPYLLLFSLLLALSVIDLELYILPNAITYPAIVTSLVAIPLLSFALADEPVRAILSAYGGGIAFAGLLLVPLLAWELIVKKEGMGMGDVKLALLLGLWLGWFHPVLPLVALILSSLFGLVVGIGVMIVRRESRPFPFGPWLALGAVVALLAAQPILRWYGFDVDDEAAAVGSGASSAQVADL